jgi:hypothetical protein
MAKARCCSVGVDGDHGQRVDHRPFGGVDPGQQVVLAVLVHQEADRAAVHAVDRGLALQGVVQGLQHEAVAAEGDDHLRGFVADLAIAGDQPFARFLRLGAVTGLEGQAGHEGQGLEHGAKRLDRRAVVKPRRRTRFRPR